MSKPSTSGQSNATSGTPDHDDRPMPGARWLTVNGHKMADDAFVTVGASAYHAGERISVAHETSIPDLPPVGGNIFTGSATIKISVENMPPVLAKRILCLLDAAVGILRADQDPSVLVDAWRHADASAEPVAETPRTS